VIGIPSKVFAELHMFIAIPPFGSGEQCQLTELHHLQHGVFDLQIYLEAFDIGIPASGISLPDVV
jgi:hypothetical protein